MTFALSTDDRKRIEANSDEAIPNYYALNCHMGIWDEGVSGSKPERSIVINQTPRKNSCFFLYIPPCNALQRRKGTTKTAV
ncbi:hypothetical protein [Rhodoferax sp.]|uniref:hypothetical protein n=1 Tax=Rhodoferax sp. TaxID=50421 RepID=UPI00374DCD25